jgi:hypothetical protein|nr:MAG TPA: hypothetical protein [Caudoviricetes sp.]
MQTEYRPCFVDGRKALFHRWTAYDIIDYAIVEYEDGTVDIVHPESIRFVTAAVLFDIHIITLYTDMVLTILKREF